MVSRDMRKCDTVRDVDRNVTTEDSRANSPIDKPKIVGLQQTKKLNEVWNRCENLSLADRERTNN
jgi:hypothetical protein